MSFRKSVGNMYPWVTHTWNVIKGECPHDCSYCYMKRFPQGELRFDKKELRRNLGEGRFIFVGSSCDMWAEDISGECIEKILKRCHLYPKNKYLFQSKNPDRFIKFESERWFSPNMIFGTTIESDINHNPNIASARHRAEALYNLWAYGFNTMISIEPIMDFRLFAMIDLIKKSKSKFVSIGADSKGHNLPEPSWDKVQDLISALKEFIEVKVKSNLERLKDGIR